MKNTFSRISRNLSRPRWYIPLVIIFIIGAGIAYSLSKDPLADLETARVTRSTIEQSVSQSGTVTPAQEAQLTAERGGKVISVLVREGQRVTRGMLLVQTDARLASAEVVSAQTRVALEESRLAEMLAGGSETDRLSADVRTVSAQATLENAQNNLKDITVTQQSLVDSARRNLLSTGLMAYLVEGDREDPDQNYTPPTISGSYTSTEMGNYTLELYGATNNSGWAFRYSGLESGTGIVSTSAPQPFGTRGLYIQFPPNFARRGTVRWLIPVPNDRSPSYVALQQAYNQAVINQDVALRAAEQAITSAQLGQLQVSTQNSQTIGQPRPEKIEQQRLAVTQARTALWQAQIGRSQTAIVSPFNGVITNVLAVPGQLATGPLVSIMSDEPYEIILDVAETDITNISVGDTATVTFDAYRGETFEAVVTQINPSAQDIGGVKTFKTSLEFTTRNPKILAGLTADVEIYTEKKEGVIAVPTRALFEKNGSQYVRIRNVNGDIVEQKVTVGMKGSNGSSEITSGLGEGDEIVTFLSEKQLELLKKKETSEKNSLSQQE